MIPRLLWGMKVQTFSLMAVPSYSNICPVNAKQRRTLDAIFRKPTPVGIRWQAIAALIQALDGEIQYRDGSKVRIDLKGQSINMRSPHPQKELKRYAVRLVRELLIRTGDAP